MNSYFKDIGELNQESPRLKWASKFLNKMKLKQLLLTTL